MKGEIMDKPQKFRKITTGFVIQNYERGKDGIPQDRVHLTRRALQLRDIEAHQDEGIAGTLGALALQDQGSLE